MYRRITTAILALAVSASPLLADPGGKPRHANWKNADRHEDGQELSSPRDLGRVIITAAERALISNYFREHPEDFGVRGLPPGIRMNLSRGKALPPGIAKKMPPGLVAGLPYRNGYRYVLAGNDVLLVAIATGIIVDVLHDILR